jgi:hypothetical protein
VAPTLTTATETTTAGGGQQQWDGQNNDGDEEEEYDNDNDNDDARMAVTNDDGWPSTRPHRREQLLAGWTTGAMDDNGDEGTRARRRGQRTHPPPASRATAHGVDRGWNDDAGQSTSHQ